MSPRRALATALIAFAALTSGANAQDASPYAIDIPAWFSESFLDFRDDVADAARDGRRVMVYFGQDGCPYCRELMVTNFSQRAIVDKMRGKFVAIALNIWGDRETVWLDGRKRSEKALARHLDVQFTPTLLFLDEQGSIAARLNGYWPPHTFEAALDYVAAKSEKREPLAAYLARLAPEPAHASLADEPFFVRPPYDLSRRPGGKPLAVVFETPYCAPCDELHGVTLRRPEVQATLGHSKWRASGSVRAPRLSRPMAPRSRPMPGRVTSRDLYARNRVFRRRRPRSIPDRRVPAAVPRRLGVRVRLERRLQDRAVVPALHPGSGPTAAQSRRACRSLAVATAPRSSRAYANGRSRASHES